MVCIATVRSSTLGAAIESIKRQTWPDWELVLVWQGDDPHLGEVCLKAERDDGRIRQLHLEQRGASRAKNAGICAATGDVLAMTDDDCEAAPEWLASIADRLNDDRIGAVGGAVLPPPLIQARIA